MPGFELFGDEERKEVNDVLESGVLFRYGFDEARNGHWKAREFEVELSNITKAKHSLLLSSGTAADTIALQACGIGAGDEVIIPPFTFVATFEAVLALGAIPVFAEIDETLNLSPEGIKQAITDRTKAVVPVHMCGSMAKIDEIRNVCQEHDLFLIEDACQAFGATHKGKYAGTFGHIGCFSFDSVKTCTCGEGGAIITDDKWVYVAADQLADHGHDHIGENRGADGHPVIGFNYRTNELNAAVGIAQIRKLDKILEIQRKNKKILKDAIKDIDGVSFRHIPYEEGDSATFLTFLLPDETSAKRVNKALADGGVDSCAYWYDNNWHYYKQWHHLHTLTSINKLPQIGMENLPDYKNIKLPKSDELISRAISMQIKLSWTDSQLKERAEKFANIIRENI